MKNKYDVGIYGTGVMGLALARNLARNGYKVAIANRTIQAAQDASEDVRRFKESRNIFFLKDLNDLTKNLKGPIILLIPSGDPQEDLISGMSTTPIDDVIFNGSESIDVNGKVTRIQPLAKLVNRNHIIIDAGNSHPYATSIRDLKLAKLGIKFLGMGVSGGEMGALKGPSMMPGGAYKTYKLVSRMLRSAAAKKGKTVCCDWMGPASAGHLVKIIHNGIEYGIMQAIAENYLLLKEGFDFSNKELHKFFKECDKGMFRGYLLEITTHILETKDENEEYVLDQILDSAGAKGTGKWTTQIASDLGVAAGNIYAALEARQLSNKKEDRVKISKLINLNKSVKSISKSKISKLAKDSLYASILTSYIQGFHILKAASKELTYTAPHRNEKGRLANYKSGELEKKLNFVKISNTWKAGCIIRSNLLNLFENVFSKERVNNLLLSKRISNLFTRYYKNWKSAVEVSQQLNLPYPVSSASLNYFQSFVSEFLPANMTQAQRDLFGAHTFRKLNDKFVHHQDWGPKYSITSSYKKLA
jgi:6-phosphogluconate dehydrogenase